ncbi:MAG: tRNA (5-methylaminomethyl-2-thiouridine)(34)-methyltransferase MnmD [Bacteroidales bacterium]|jgi:tRNA U34 5-methylaminomethyl-2-thiouridine-forming methyltransferase MnmC|nr:tRNA (5-methylaminomethyl-2-thiouridine)(34)-methyltransferase MnmD [Bacteroidales bacterium]
MINIVRTEDGSDTLYVDELQEHYHSVYGAIRESEFIFINSGLKFSGANPARIFEAGFGTGLNALLTAVHALSGEKEIIYTSIEKFPLSEIIINSLNYKNLISDEGKQIYDLINSCLWNTPVRILNNFVLHKIKGDLITDELEGEFDLIYFDAFGPDKQPEIWSEEVFRKISEHTVRNGVLVTYSVKGSVRRLLEKNGFKTSLLPGPPGKRQILRAIKI